MSWGGAAARALAETVAGWFPGGEAAVGAAAVEGSGTVIVTSPAGLAEDARFEIGSVTKTMTATVLAMLAAEGALSLDDPIGRWLSAGPHGGITVRQLATHTSGLPAVAPNRGAADPADPWAGYTFERAEEGLRAAAARPGQPWRYSNLGYQLLGLIEQRAAGVEYPRLLDERLLGPLGMTCSGTAGRGAGTPLAGHAAGRLVPRWEHPLGAGGVEASIADLGRYARACLLPPGTPLGAAIRAAQQPVLPAGNGTAQALAWAVRGGACWHTGGTGGFTACVMADHERQRAVAALVSSGGSPALASRLQRAADLVLNGADPRDAAEPQPWPDWRDDAVAVVRALVGGDVAGVHARLAAPRRAVVSAAQLARAWAAAVPHATPGADVTVLRHEIAATGAVVADLAVTSDAATASVRLVILATGELAGFTPLPPAPA